MGKATTKTAVIDLKRINRFTFLTLLSMGILLFLSNSLFAQEQESVASPMGEVLCSAAGMVIGDIGRGLATLAVIAVGIGALVGKASWGMALTVASGIAVVFGAPGIVALLTGGIDGCNGGSGGLAQYYSGMYANNGKFASGGDCSQIKDSVAKIACQAKAGGSILNTADDALGTLGSIGSTIGGWR